MDLVETTVIRSPHGLVIPLVNWSQGPLKALRIKLHLAHPFSEVSLASGKTVTSSGDNSWIFDLDVADALILRAKK